MALSIVRKGVASLTGCAGRSLVAPTTVLRPQVATIVSKNMRPEGYKRPPPYAYKSTSYNTLLAMFDKTTFRFDENSKIIVVDGPIGVDRGTFAKEIAEELDMLYVPQANMDMKYITPEGFDIRQLDHKMPFSCKSFDEKDFHRDPKHINAVGFQFHMLRIRLEQYIDAIAHVLSTGQGVVMDRSVYSDVVFAESMAKFGYMRQKVLNYYYECQKSTVPLLMRPHLVVYLDASPDVCLDLIKKRGRPHEVNSSVLTRDFLSHMEFVYKQQVLKELGQHSEVLIYDWSEEGDPEVVVEDIERLEFEFPIHDPKMADWRYPDEWAWCEKRIQFTKYKKYFFHWLAVPDFTMKEINIAAPDVKTYLEVMDEVPGNKYEYGFNPDVGDDVSTKVFREKAQ